MPTPDSHLEDVIERIRQQARQVEAPLRAGSLRKVIPTGGKASVSSASILRRELIACQNLQNAVGEINPRPPGFHNYLVQRFKKLIQRLLTWYTRPIRDFQSAVTRALLETQSLLSSQADEIEQLKNQIRDEAAHVAAQGQAIEALHASLEKRAEDIKVETLSLSDSYLGPKAKEGLWFNDPITMVYDPHGRPSWAGTNERIIEKPWVLRRLGDLAPGARILDVGCAESLLPLELASNGFQVVGVDIRSYPLEHPNLSFIRAEISKAPLEPCSFDAAILLSTIEHVGLGWYGDPKGEALRNATMRQIARALKSTGLLLMTAPFGNAAVTPLQVIFDSAGIKKLLSGFHISQMEYGIRKDEKTWIMPVEYSEAQSKIYDPETMAPSAVVLIEAQKTEDRETLAVIASR